MEPIISVKNISKEFIVEGDQQIILRDINFVALKHEFICIVGPSGCGKSTLLRIMAGLEKSSSGSIEMEAGSKLAMVFQNFALFPWLNVEENVGFGLRLLDGEAKANSDKVKKYISEMGLTGVEEKHPKELSGGMRQRVGIARALAIEPDILFLDEPFSALDTFTSTRLRRELLNIWQEKNLTVVMVSHLIEEAVELADRIIVLSANPGSVQSIEEIELPRPRNIRSEEFFKYVDKIEGMIKA